MLQPRKIADHAFLEMLVQASLGQPRHRLPSVWLAWCPNNCLAACRSVGNHVCLGAQCDAASWPFQ